ncbi:MAG: hypothetical protein V3V14_13060 [Saprospiraceae bacterium]
MNNQSSGNIASGLFRAMQGIYAKHYNFDFDTKCTISGFSLTRITLTGERNKVINRSGKYSEESIEIIVKSQIQCYFFS